MRHADGYGQGDLAAAEGREGRLHVGDWLYVHADEKCCMRSVRALLLGYVRVRTGTLRMDACSVWEVLLCRPGGAHRRA